MKIVDVHCHLNDSRFDVDRTEVIERFEEKGGEVIVTSGVNPASNRASLELSEKYDVVRAAFGIYPVDALAAEVASGESNELLRELEEFDVDEELAWIEAHAEDCVAIGEIGLDYNYKEFQTESNREKQKEVFRKCLRLAKKLGKVVVIHSRKAEADAVEILEEEGFAIVPKGTPPAQTASVSADKVGVVMHCFNGKKALIRRCVENGWSFSVPAVIVRLEHFKMLVRMVPLENLLTETDGAYLAPVAGTRNEPVNVLVTLEEIARIKGIGVEKVSEKVWENAERLFEF